MKRAKVYQKLFEVSPTPAILELVYHALLNDDDQVTKACPILLGAWEKSPATQLGLLSKADRALAQLQ